MVMIFILSADTLPQQMLEDSGLYYGNEVICNGNENRLIDCADGFKTDCSQGYSAGVKCLSGTCLLVVAFANCIDFLGVFTCSYNYSYVLYCINFVLISYYCNVLIGLST